MSIRSTRMTSSAVVALLFLAGCGGASVSGGGNEEPISAATPTFSPAAGTVATGTVVTVTCATAGAALYVGKTNPPTTAASSFTVDAAGTWYAQAKLGGVSSTVASAAYAITSTAPSAPSGLSAVAQSSSSIQLTWTDTSNNESGFRIERAPDATGSPGTFAEIATTAANATSYTGTGLSARTTYWYRVRATNGVGNSPYSGNAHATTSAPPTTLTFTSSTCPAPTQGSSYSCTLTADGGTPPYTFSVVTTSGYSLLPRVWR